MSDPPAPFNPQAGGPAFSVANKAERALWRICWLLLARWTLPPLFAWRAALLRLFGAQVGAGARVYGSASIWLPRNLSLGERAVVGPGAILYNQGRISIGARSVISQRAHLCASTHNVHDPRFALETRPITVEPGCWVAAEAFVGPGVRMAAGAVLGARGALFTDAEPMAIYRGNPAARIGTRHWRGAAEAEAVTSRR